jgi:hypothetical protein
MLLCVTAIELNSCYSGYLAWKPEILTLYSKSMSHPVQGPQRWEPQIFLHDHRDVDVSWAVVSICFLTWALFYLSVSCWVYHFGLVGISTQVPMLDVMLTRS